MANIRLPLKNTTNRWVWVKHPMKTSLYSRTVYSIDDNLCVLVQKQRFRLHKLVKASLNRPEYYTLKPIRGKQ